MSNNNNDLTDMFGPVIYSYTSQQAVEDGILVPVTSKDAVTRTVWEYINTRVPNEAPPDRWPVEMMGWFRAGGKLTKKEALKLIAKHGADAQEKYDRKVRDDKTLAMTKGLIGSESKQAIQKEDAGGIFEIHFAETETQITGIVGAPGADTKTMWLRPNELGGVTLMFPEDN